MTEQKTVLVVDDEPDMVSLIQTKLEKEGYAVEVAYNGIEGLEKARKNPPDAVVLDVMMPEKDGYKMCKEMKGDEALADIPVIMLTAVASHVSSTRYSHYDGMSMEADDYIPKGPDAINQIVQSLKSFLK